MPWIAVDSDGEEYVYEEKPDRGSMCWSACINTYPRQTMNYVRLPKGSIKKLIGRELKWKNEPVELK